MKKTLSFASVLFLCSLFAQAATFTVTVTNDSGAGTFRQAVMDANASPGADIIHFNITGSFSILPSSAFPLITDPVTIDGTTQPGYAGSPIVELNGQSAGAGVDGLRVSAGSSVIRGLIINRFTSDGIEFSINGSNLVENCIVGLDTNATDRGNTACGIVITNSANNVIGGTNASQRNVISGNNQHGIMIQGVSATNNLIVGNFIGLSLTGGSTRPNSGVGISITNAPNNIIGGTISGSLNVISGNSSGVRMDGTNSFHNKVVGNYIGLDPTGTVDLGNSSYGIHLVAAGTNTVGGTTAEARNIISGNGTTGIRIENTNSRANVIIGNYIGTDITGELARGNGSSGGVHVTLNAFGNQIGGSAAGEPNKIWFNGGDGVHVETGTNNVIRGNSISANGGLGIDIGSSGVLANDANDADTGANQLQNYPILTAVVNTVGGVQVSGDLNSRVSTGFILDFYSNITRDSATNGEAHVWLGSTNVTTDGSGNVSFTTQLPAIAYGRHISATATDPFGNTSELSPCIAASSTISPATFTVVNTNNSGAGSLRQAIVDANSTVSSGSDVIGFNIPGAGPHTISPTSELPAIYDSVTIDGTLQPGASANTLAVGNNAVWKIVLEGVNAGSGSEGLRLESSNNIVRGLAVTRFSGNGIEIVTNRNNKIEGCLIGLGLDATDQGNSSGILISSSSDNVIGGTIPQQRNVISGNNTAGIAATGTTSTNNLILGNYIGTDPTGTIPRGNGDGINLNSTPFNTIGGAASGSANLISGNNADGLELTGTGSTNNVVLGNRIGTDVTGTSAVPNNNNGVNISGNARFNSVGGLNANEGNQIWYNNQDGVAVSGTSSTNNTIRGNTFFSNGDLAIDLGANGKTTNDVNDVDTGANLQQNYPVLTGATIHSNNVVISGNLNSKSNTVFQLDFYANSAMDPSTNGEGQVYLGSTNVTTDATSNITFTVTFSGSLNKRFISAIATDPTGNTSEFSPCARATSTVPPVTYTVVNTNDSGAGSLRQAILDNNATAHSTNNTIAFNISGAGPHLLQPLTILPTITESVTIDGYTQPGASVNTLSTGHNAVIKIRLDGFTHNSELLRFHEVSNCVVRGLSLTRSSAQKIDFLLGGNHIIEGNYFGLEPDGVTIAANNYGEGLEMTRSTGNRIGGPSPASRNVFAGNGGYEILISRGTNTVIQNNYIGTDRSGTLLKGAGSGIAMTDSANNLIGGTTATLRNLISGNLGPGIIINGNSSSNVIQGNFIGTDITGVSAISNGGQGVQINALGGGNTIGGIGAGAANRFAFNNNGGIQVSSSTNNVIRGNSIFNNNGLGIDLGSSGILSNDAGDGDTGANQQQNFPILASASATITNIVIQGSLNSRSNASFDLDFYSNTQCDSSGNGEGRTWLGSTNVTTDATGNVNFTATLASVIAGRYVTATATDLNGNTSEFSPCTAAISSLPPATFTVINTNDSGAGSLRQAILNNNDAANGTNNTIAFNIPGAGPHVISLLTSLPSIVEPAVIDGYTQAGSSVNTATNAFNAVIKIRLQGTNLLEILNLAGNSNIVRGLALVRGGYGITVSGKSNSVQGCVMGITESGVVSSNYFAGVHVFSGSGHLIGGVTPATRNVISGNYLNGLTLRSGSSNCLVQGNFIGTSFSGMTNAGNQTGIYAESTVGHLIGGLVAGARNIVSGNGQKGIHFYASSSNHVQGNFIGLNALGTAGVMNADGGIALQNSAYNIIGGATASARNLISGNYGEGVDIYFTGAVSNRVIGNFIGTDVTGTNPVPNLGNGIFAGLEGNVIGGEAPGEGNRIAYNFAGVSVATNCPVRRNEIFNNSTLGIGSGGVLPNDPGDADVGGQNYPVLTSATLNPSSTRIQGSLNSKPNWTYALDFFSNPVPDPSGYGEGQKYLGSTNVVTDGSGNVTFDVTFAVAAFGRYISSTATAAAPENNTSQFSQSIRAISTIPPTTFVVVNTNDSGAGSLRQSFLDSVFHAGSGPHTIAFNIPGTNFYTISPLSELPTLLEPLIIDGFTQLGASPATDTNSDNAIRKITLDGLLAGQASGLVFTNQGNTVRGLEIRNFSVEGIDLKGGSNVVEGCYIHSNALAGVHVNRSPGNRIGGNNAAKRNVISGNGADGIKINGTTAIGNRVEGNFIGADLSGMFGLPNDNNGILIDDSPLNIIGGGGAATRNIIGGNTGAGIEIIGANSVSNLVQGNHIGATPAASNLGNADGGVKIGSNARKNIIGEPRGTGSSLMAGKGTITSYAYEITGLMNLIAYNQQDGIFAVSGTNNTFRANRIFDNAHLGIDLSPDGINANDLTDSDVGANDRQNYPLLTNVLITASNMVVEGTFNSHPSTTYQIDFYRNVLCDTLLYGEGEFWVGSVFITTDLSGNAFFNVGVVGGGLGTFVTCTATDPLGNTSEFSPCVQAQSGLSPQTFVVTNVNDDGPGSLRQAINSANQNPASGPHTINFNVAGSGDLLIALENQPLPVLAVPVNINGLSQPGSTPQKPRILVSGKKLPGAQHGLRATKPNTTIRGLELSGFGGDGIRAESGSSVTIQNNIIGNDTPGGGIGGDGVNVFSGAGNSVIQDNTFAQLQGNGIFGPSSVPILAQNNTARTLDDQLVARTGSGVSAPILEGGVCIDNDTISISGYVFGASNTQVTIELSFITSCDPVSSTPAQTIVVTINNPSNSVGNFTVQLDLPPDAIGIQATATRPGNNTSSSSSCFLFDDICPIPYSPFFTFAANTPQAGTVQDPISTFTGEFFDALPPDIDLGGPMPLLFQRVYGARLKPDGRIAGKLGENWLHNFEMFLTNKTTTVEVVHYPATYLLFTNQTGSYNLLNRKDVPYQLRATNANFLFLDPRSQRIYTFNNTGKLIKIEDGRGNAHTLTYVGANLDTVSDGLGRMLSFQYGPGGTFLTNVTDGTRSVGFSQGTNLLLTSKNPLGFAMTYEYGVSNQAAPLPYASLLARKVFPETNSALLQTYNSDGKVQFQNNGSGTWSLTYVANATQVRDPMGFTVLHRYSSNALLTAWADEAGREIKLGYNTNGQRTAVTNRLGQVTRLAYHVASGKVSAITNADGTVTTFTYTNRVVNGVTNFDLIAASFADGSSEQFTYDANGNLTSTIDRAQQLWRFNYNARGQLLSSTNPAGGAVFYTYNTNGTMASAQDPETGFTLYHYDALKRLTNITFADGTDIRFGYDANNRLISRKDERNNTTQYTYDRNGRLIEIIDADSRTNRFAYDAQNRFIAHTDRLGQVSGVGYDSRGLVDGVTNRNGFMTTFTYDRRQQLTLIRDPENQFTRFGYDFEGRQIVSTNETLAVTQISRDMLGSVIGMTNPLGHVTSVQRDSMRRVTNRIDGLGRTYGYRYDQRGHLTNAVHPGAGAVSIQRTALGRISRITDLNGRQWNFGYSPLGRLVSQSDPLNRTNSHTYDNRGRMLRTAYPDGVSATNTYDGVGNLTRRRFSDGTDLQYSYDKLNRLTNANGIVLAYDAEGRLLSELSAGISTTAAYDAGGRLTNLNYNGVFNVAYAYNSRDELETVRDTLSGTMMTFYRDAAGRLRNVYRSSPIDTTYTYDAAGRLVRIQEGNIIDVSYTLDAASQVIAANFKAPLDPAEYASAIQRNFSYDAAHQISTAGYTYDARGRLRNTPGNTFTFNGASDLTQINGVVLGYDDQGEIRTRTAGGVTTRFVRARALAMAPIIAERNESNLQIQRYYIWSPQGELLYMIDAANGNAVRYFHFDRVGSTLAMTDTSGNVTDAYAWSPHGELLARTGTNPQPFTFIGQYGVRSEPAANLFHMRARYYDPATGRFLSPDPIWPRLSGLNPYQYASENPLKNIDPLGLQDFAQGPESTIDRQDATFIVDALYLFVANLAPRDGSGIGIMTMELPSERRRRELNEFMDLQLRLRNANGPARTTTDVPAPGTTPITTPADTTAPITAAVPPAPLPVVRIPTGGAPSSPTGTRGSPSVERCKAERFIDTAVGDCDLLVAEPDSSMADFFANGPGHPPGPPVPGAIRNEIISYPLITEGLRNAIESSNGYFPAFAVATE